MALVTPVGFGRVIHSLKLVGDPEPMAITYGIGVQDADPFTVDGLAEACSDALFNNVFDEVSNQITLVQTEVYFQIDPLPDPPVVGIYADGGVGADALSIVPQNTAFLCHKRTNYGGRGGRGRFYLPGVQESQVDNVGVVISGKVTALNTRLAAMLTDLAAFSPSLGMFVLHDSAGAHAADPPRQVTSLTCDSVVATQRRRLRH